MVVTGSICTAVLTAVGVDGVDMAVYSGRLDYACGRVYHKKKNQRTREPENQVDNCKSEIINRKSQIANRKSQIVNHRVTLSQIAHLFALRYNTVLMYTLAALCPLFFVLS